MRADCKNGVDDRENERIGLGFSGFLEPSDRSPKKLAGHWNVSKNLLAALFFGFDPHEFLGKKDLLPFHRTGFCNPAARVQSEQKQHSVSDVLTLVNPSLCGQI